MDGRPTQHVMSALPTPRPRNRQDNSHIHTEDREPSGPAPIGVAWVRGRKGVLAGQGTAPQSGAGRGLGEGNGRSVVIQDR